MSPLSDASLPVLTAIEPSIPLDLALADRSATSIRFTWKTPADSGGIEITGYTVMVAEGNDPYTVVTDAAAATDPTKEYHEHTSSNLVAGQTYKFRVAAVNFVGTGDYAQLRTSQELLGDVVDYVLAADLPEAPVNPPTVVNITQNAITLTLEDVPEASNGG
jgi:hypothetical protein